jgi:hypothetical protein
MMVPFGGALRSMNRVAAPKEGIRDFLSWMLSLGVLLRRRDERS